VPFGSEGVEPGLALALAPWSSIGEAVTAKYASSLLKKSQPTARRTHLDLRIIKAAIRLSAFGNGEEFTLPEVAPSRLTVRYQIFMIIFQIPKTMRLVARPSRAQRVTIPLVICVSG
jgi:hypothetical protein